MMRDIPEVLTWNAPQAHLAASFLGYLDRVSDAFGEHLGKAEREAPAAHKRLSAALERIDDEGFMRALLAPETTYRLLHRREPAVLRLHFLVAALEAEIARAEGDPAAGIWTALGDMGWRADGMLIENPRLRGGPVFDILSPHASAVDLGGPSGVTPRDPFEAEALRLIVDKLQAAVDGVHQAGRLFGEFAARFNFVFIAQTDRDDPGLFTSGSTGQYIGRSFITNPHRDSVRPIDLAEAMIHEGVHALLYMEEGRSPWVLNRDLYDPMKTRVVSPWTGSPLGVRPFLQAGFVWFALLHFWSAAWEAAAFDRPMIHERMTLALRGFLAGPLEDRVADVRKDIAPEVRQAIAAMQAHVVEAWPASCL